MKSKKFLYKKKRKIKVYLNKNFFIYINKTNNFKINFK